jgi:hypothetical protein
MPDRQKHQVEVCRYLQKHFFVEDWRCSLPPGTGLETYFVQGNRYDYFVKVGAPVERYQVMAEMGLAPPVLSVGQLESGLPIIVQPLIKGQTPSRLDFQNRLETVAALIHKMHSDPRIKSALKPASSTLYQEMALQSLHHIRQKWERYKEQVTDVADFVDKSLEKLARQIDQLSGEGLAACHNDICNANWLFASDGKIYILDLESMSMEDPALDMGALLWWYYPPEMRQRFLEIAGYSYDDEFKVRMQIRMALHCLSIPLPREHSFDEFRPDLFYAFLLDFKAVLDGQENPQGYAA